MVWDDTKRLINLEKHQLDFADAGLVLSNRFRLEFEVVPNGEVRRQAFAYVAEVLTVLTVFGFPEKRRVISVFEELINMKGRRYHAWLEKDLEE
jgi:uncharacterized protein